MAYSDKIELLMNALNGYSEEENKLSDLYKTAISNAEKAYEANLKQLDEQYYHDRNEIYADVARDERNFDNVLAARGLGFSGESAQGKLNSNITLNNRLGELKRDKNAAALQYRLDFENSKSDLAKEQSQKLYDMFNDKNKLNVDIAGMELSKETDDAKLKADAEANAAKLKADAEANAAKIQAEKDMLAIKLQAEKEMQEAELAAKYYGSGTGSGGTGSGSGSGNGELKGEETESGFIPDISAKELAKQLVSSAADGNSIESVDHEYMINKYLLGLKEYYGIDEDYYNDLIFMLKIYGYNQITEPEMRVQVIAYDADSYYKENYNNIYSKLVLSGVKENLARQQSRAEAKEKQLDYIYNRSKNVTEFRMCCDRLYFSDLSVQEYLNKLEVEKKNESGSSGTASGYPTRTTK